MVSKRIIVALDGMSAFEARQTMSGLRQEVDIFKVGFEMIARQEVNEVLAAANTHGKSIFYDGKLHDIPATVGKAARIIAEKRGVSMFNVHCLGGEAMMIAAKQAVESDWPTQILGVTLLTSMDYNALVQIGLIKRYDDQVQSADVQAELVESSVIKLAAMAKSSGLDGVIASPKEASGIRALLGPNFTIVTPGVRPVGSDTNDQARVTTPGAAIRAGSDYLVIGRPITQPESGTSLDAAKRINDEIAQAMEERE